AHNTANSYRKFSLATAFHRTAFISRRTKAAYYQYCGQSQNWIMSAHIAASTQGLTTAVRWRYLAWTRVNLELERPSPDLAARPALRETVVFKRRRRVCST